MTTWIQKWDDKASRWFGRLPVQSQTAIVMLFVVVLMIGVAVVADLVTKPGFDAYELCIENGYSDLKKARGVYWCVGVRDGNTATIKAEDLGQ